jgi:hypothetical protein
MILRKTDLHVTFFLDGTPFRALSKGTEVIYDHKFNKLIFFFSFPSYKTNLDLNQDASEILNYIETFDTLEFDDEYVIKSLNKIQIGLEIDKVGIEVVLKLPKEKIHIFEDVQIQLDDSRMTFKVNIK